MLKYNICGSAITPAGMASVSICSRRGHKRNKTANIANAAINTALFHMGKRPSKKPEKINPGIAARKTLAVETLGCLGCAAGLAGAALVGPGRFSAEVALPGLSRPHPLVKHLARASASYLMAWPQLVLHKRRDTESPEKLKPATISQWRSQNASG